MLVIQDDYYSFLSQQPFHSIIGPEHRRWALVRSVSKFVGPDMCLAVTATDPDTAGRLALRLSPGTTWVSHLLQRITHAVMAAPESLELIHRAGAHYAERNAAFAARLTALGLPVEAGDGMSLWVPVPVPAREVADRLMRRGWLVRTRGRVPPRRDRRPLAPPAADRPRPLRGRCPVARRRRRRCRGHPRLC